jgi:hypothetical protein
MSNKIKYIVKLKGLNPMTVEAERAQADGALIHFTNAPNEEGKCASLLAVNVESLEYFGPEGHFEVANKR